MNDRLWMLNPSAIRIAEQCIQLVTQELDITLRLSHPEFMQLLHGYVELSESRELNEAYGRLLAFAGVGKAVRGLKAKPSETVLLKASGADVPIVNDVWEEETIRCGGQEFPRSRDGAEFVGVYRGQPRYK